jgi:tRNA-splicing ligase RtcB
MKTITGTDLRNAGFKAAPSMGVALSIIEGLKKPDKKKLLNELKNVRADPFLYIGHERWSPVAEALVAESERAAANERIELLEPKPYTVYGAGQIEEGALSQMETAMRLPVTAAGALMPDAHQGYGLPIGGVLATKNAVIPYGVGVDIGCRMCMSVYDIPASFFEQHQSFFKRELLAHSKFGAGQEWKKGQKADHEVLERGEFRQLALLRSLLDKAHAQLGTSGALG